MCMRRDIVTHCCHSHISSFQSANDVEVTVLEETSSLQSTVEEVIWQKNINIFSSNTWWRRKIVKYCMVLKWMTGDNSSAALPQ